MSLISLITDWIKNGIRIGWNDGRAFDPTDQERTDPIDDIIKEKEKKT